MVTLVCACMVGSMSLTGVQAAQKGDKVSFMQDTKKANGVYKVGSTYRYFDNEGKIYRGKAKLVHADKGIYYVKKDGSTFHGWNVLGNKLYNFSGKGNRALTNTTSRNVKLLASG